MELETIMLSRISQTQGIGLYVFSHVRTGEEKEKGAPHKNQREISKVEERDLGEGKGETLGNEYLLAK